MSFNIFYIFYAFLTTVRLGCAITLTVWATQQHKALWKKKHWMQRITSLVKTLNETNRNRSHSGVCEINARYDVPTSKSFPPCPPFTQCWKDMQRDVRTKTGVYFAAGEVPLGPAQHWIWGVKGALWHRSSVCGRAFISQTPDGLHNEIAFVQNKRKRPWPIQHHGLNE